MSGSEDDSIAGDGSASEVKKEAPYRRKINKRYMAKTYNKTEILTGINSMIENGKIYRNLSVGPMKKLNKEQLLTYVASKFLANLEEEILFIRDNVLGGTEADLKEDPDTLAISAYSHTSIKAATRSLLPKFKPAMVYSLKKDDLIRAIMKAGRAKEVITALTETTTKDSDAPPKKKAKTEQSAEASPKKDKTEQSPGKATENTGKMTEASPKKDRNDLSPKVTFVGL